MKFLQRLLLPGLLLAVAPFASLAEAQIVKVVLKSEKDAKKLEKYLSNISGRAFLIGEVDEGITFDNGTFTKSPGRCSFFVPDPADPSAVPYKDDKDGKRVAVAQKYLVAVSGDKIESVDWFDRNETFAGLAKEYGIRLSNAEELRAARDTAERGSAERQASHLRYVSALKALHSWLENTCYGEAAKKLLKDVEKEEKVIGKQEQEYRLKAALDSIGKANTPDDLADAAQKVTNGLATFSMMESKHIRFVYCNEVDADRITKLLELGETGIDAFRTQYVDPFVEIPAFADRIPDDVFMEFCFTPAENQRVREEFLGAYYGVAWGKNKERALESVGNIFRLGKPTRDLSYRRLTENDDLEGWVMHSLGHALADWHYNKGTPFDKQAWIPEAVGYFLSFEFLGRNSVTCFQWRDQEAERYRKERRRKPEDLKEGEKTATMGMRDIFNSLALDEGPKIDKLGLKTLFELENADLAKAWSLYDFLIRKHGKKGQEFLRSAGQASRDPAKMMDDWRTDTEQIFGIAGQDVFKWLDDAWREFAMHEQDKSAAGK